MAPSGLDVVIASSLLLKALLYPQDPQSTRYFSSLTHRHLRLPHLSPPVFQVNSSAEHSVTSSSNFFQNKSINNKEQAREANKKPIVQKFQQFQNAQLKKSYYKSSCLFLETASKYGAPTSIFAGCHTASLWSHGLCIPKPSNTYQKIFVTKNKSST